MLAQINQILEPLEPWARLLLFLILSGGTGVLVAIVITALVRRLGEPGVTLLPTLAQPTAAPLRLCLPAVGMTVVLRAIRPLNGPTILLLDALELVVIGLVGWLSIRAVRGLVAYVAGRHETDHADNLEDRQIQTQTRLLARVAVFLIIVATIAGMMLTIPSIRNVGMSLFASAGLAGLVIGFAARPTLGNLIAGIQLAFTQPIRLDDVVIVEGEWGRIEEINLTFVVVRIWDLRRLVVPISYFIEKPFQNWTRTNADLLGSVLLQVDYRVPVEEIRAEFGRALRDCPEWDGKVQAVHVTDCTDRALEVRLLMSAPESGKAWDLRCKVRERLIAYLQAHHPDSLPRIRLEGPAPGEDAAVQRAR